MKVALICLLLAAVAYGYPSYNDDAVEKYDFGNNFEMDHDAPMTAEDKEFLGTFFKNLHPDNKKAFYNRFKG
jgi:hypothetical protein